jgi:hypothetical protein
VCYLLAPIDEVFMPFESIDDFVAQYQQALESDWYWWKTLDQPILDLCEQHPGHADVRVNFAKIALVNRTYRANLHMGAKGAEWALAGLLRDQHADALVAPLQQLATFGANELPVVVDVHRALVVLVRDEVTGRRENSFLAKYLSFHLPEVVPLFDKYAYARGWQLAGHALEQVDYEEWPNSAYCYYCEVVALLAGRIRDAGIETVNLKLVDNMLYDRSW